MTDDAPPEGTTARREQVQAAYREHLAGLDTDLARALPAEFDATFPDHVVLSDGRALTSTSLLATLRRQSQTSGGPPLPIRPGGERSAVVVAVAWRQVVYRQVAAVLLLVDGHLQQAAVPNARVALEHAFRLNQLRQHVETGDVSTFLGRLLSSSQLEGARTLKALAHAASGVGEQWASVVEQAAAAFSGPDRGERAGAVFEGSPNAKVLYRLMSEASHAGLGSVQPYLADFLVTGNAGRVDQPFPQWAEVLVHLVWSCWIADRVLDLFVDGGDLAVRHDALLAEIGLRFSIRTQFWRGSAVDRRLRFEGPLHRRRGLRRQLTPATPPATRSRPCVAPGSWSSGRR